MFHVVQKEMQWRKTQGLPEGFDMLKKMKPTVAIGAKEPLGGQTMMADYYRTRAPQSKQGEQRLTSCRWRRWPRRRSHICNIPRQSLLQVLTGSASSSQLPSRNLAPPLRPHAPPAPFRRHPHRNRNINNPHHPPLAFPPLQPLPYSLPLPHP